MNELQHRTAALAVSMLHGAWPNQAEGSVPLDVALPLISAAVSETALHGLSTDQALAKIAMGILTHLSRMSVDSPDPEIASVALDWSKGHTPNMSYTARPPVNEINIHTGATLNPAEGETAGVKPEEPPAVGFHYDPDREPVMVPVVWPYRAEESADLALGIDAAVASVTELVPDKPKTWEEFYAKGRAPRRA